MKALTLQKRMGVVSGLFTVLLAVGTFLFLYRLASSQILAFQINVLQDSFSDRRQGMGEAEVLKEGIRLPDWKKFVAQNDVPAAGFFIDDGGVSQKAVWVEKRPNGTFAFARSSFSLAAWLMQCGERLAWFIGLFSIGAGSVIFFLARFSLQPLRQLRQTTEDILAGKFEVNPRNLGGDDLGQTFSALDRLCGELEQKGKALETVSELANIDGMTGLKNHRSFKEAFMQQLLLAQRHEMTLGILLLDVDHFKKFNDSYGHQQGDEVLKTVAQVLRENIRRTDFVARYGGEEFVVILPHTPKEGTLEAAEKIRQAIASRRVASLKSSDLLTVTTSIGALVIEGASLSKQVPPPLAGMLEATDKNLYQAKSKGRNRTVISIWSSEG